MLRTDIAVTFITKIARILALALGTVILARALGPSGRGLYAVALLLPRTIGMLVQLGQAAVNGTFPGLYPDKRKSIFAQVILFGIIASVVGIVALVAYMFWLPWPKGRFESLPVSAIYLGIALLLVEVFSHVIVALSRGCGYVKTTSLIEAGTAVFQALGFLLVLVVLGGSINSAMVVTILSAVLTLVFCTVLIRKYTTLNPKHLSWSLIKESLSFGIIVTFSTMAIFMVSQVSLYLMSFMKVSLADIGIFAVAVQLATELGIIPDTVARAYLPRLSNDLKARSQQTPQVYRMTLLACCFMAIGVVAVSPWVLRLLYGEDFAASIIPFLLLVPGILFFGSTRVLGVYFWAKKKPQYGLISNWTALAVTAVVSFVLIRFYGILGAAIGKTSGQIVLGLMTLFWFRKESGVPVRDLVIKVDDFRELWKMVKNPGMFGKRKKKPLKTDLVPVSPGDEQ